MRSTRTQDMEFADELEVRMAKWCKVLLKSWPEQYNKDAVVVVDPVGSFEHCGMSPRTGVFYEVRMDVRRPAADADDADDAEPPVDELEAAVVDAGWTGSRRTGLSLGDVRASVGVAVPMNTSTDAAITLRTGRCAVFPDGRAEDLRRADDEPLDAS